MKYKHITALLTAAALLLCGCQSVPKTDPAAVEQPTIQTDADGDVTPLAEDPLTDHVKAERLTPPNELGWITSAVQTADGILLLGNSTAILRYEPASGTWTQTELAKMAPYEGFYDCGGLVSAGEDGFHRLTVMENHNNMGPADGGDTNYDFWEQYYSSCVTEFWLCTYAPDGTLSGKVQVTGLEDYPDADGNILPHDLLWEDDGGFLTLMDGTILRITADGSVTKTEDAPATKTFDQDTPLSALFRDNHHEELRMVIDSWRPYLVDDDAAIDALQLSHFVFDKKRIYSNHVYYDLLDLDSAGALQVSLRQLSSYLSDHSNLSNSYATLYRQIKKYRQERP